MNEVECPKCGSTNTAPIPASNIVQCGDCWEQWESK